MAITGQENEYDPGDVAVIRATFTNNVPGAVTVKWLKPDGVTTGTASMTNDGGGAYHYDLALDAAGRWFYQVTGTAPGAAVEEGSLLVRTLTVP